MPSVKTRYRGSQFLLKYTGIHDQMKIVESIACKTEALDAEIVVMMACKLSTEDILVLLKVLKPLCFRGEELFKVESITPDIELLKGQDIELKITIKKIRTLKDFVCIKDNFSKSWKEQVTDSMIRKMLDDEVSQEKEIAKIESKIKIHYTDGTTKEYRTITNNEPTKKIS